MKEILRVIERYPGAFQPHSELDGELHKKHVKLYKIKGEETLLGVYDTTISRIGTKGILFTDRALYWNAIGSRQDGSRQNVGRLSYKDLLGSNVRLFSEGSSLVFEVKGTHPAQTWKHIEIRPLRRGTGTEEGFHALFNAIRTLPQE